MSSQVSLQEENDHLYQKMKVSQPGIMLLVRLYADMSEEGIDRLRMFRDLGTDLALDEWAQENSRLGVTVRWLMSQFGHANTLRAIRETASEILGTLPGID